MDLAEVEDRLLSNIEYDTNGPGCWLWSGYTNEKGYGRTVFGGRKYFTHRLAYRVWRGAIPKGLCVCHSCDTPACLNPEHFFLDTKAGNIKDRHKKARDAKWEGHGMAKLVIEDVRAIRGLKGQKSMTEIGRLFGIHRRQVGRIFDETSWKGAA